MSTSPPPWDPFDDTDERYRRASELDPSRPSEATRRAVLAHAARLAAERTRRDARRRWLSLAGITPRWRPAVVGTLAAAVLAAVVIAPQFLAPRAPAESELGPATAPVPAASAPATAPAAERAEERARTAAPVESAGPAAPAVTLQRARLPSSPHPEALRESAPTNAAPSPPTPAPASDAASSSRRAGQGANASVARDVAPAAAISRAAPAPRPVTADPQALRHAAATGDVAALTTQLASGSDIDARDTQGRTALLLATLNGQTNAVAVLLAHGADPNVADAHGTTPLQAAIAADEREISATLKGYGAR